MTDKKQTISREKQEISIEEVNRILDVGYILQSVLTPEELDQLKEIISPPWRGQELGNAGVT